MKVMARIESSTTPLCLQLMLFMPFLPIGTASAPTEVLCFLVAVRPVRGLLLRAKDLFVDAEASGVVGLGLENRRHHATKVQ